MLIEMRSNEMYSKIGIGKYLSDKFPIQNGLTQEATPSHSFLTLFQNMLSRMSRKIRKDSN